MKEEYKRDKRIARVADCIPYASHNIFYLASYCTTKVYLKDICGEECGDLKDIAIAL